MVLSTINPNRKYVDHVNEHIHVHVYTKNKMQ